MTIDEIRQKFGSEVALLVDGVTKLTQIKFSNVEDRKAEKPAQNAACHEPGCPRDDHKAV